MYEWAKDKPEYEEERERYRQQQATFSEQTIERLSFFKFIAKVCQKILFKKIPKGIFGVQVTIIIIALCYDRLPIDSNDNSKDDDWQVVILAIIIDYDVLINLESKIFQSL